MSAKQESVAITKDSENHTEPRAATAVSTHITAVNTMSAVECRRTGGRPDGCVTPATMPFEGVGSTVGSVHCVLLLGRRDGV